MANRKPGSYDPGAVSNGATEAELALDLVLIGRAVLSNTGFVVGLTRDDAGDPSPVASRDDNAERWGADAFISIHLNASATSQASGTETLYRDVQDLRLAAAIQHAALLVFGLKDRGCKPEGASQHSTLAIFDYHGPACLLEVGFITNLRDLGQIEKVDLQKDFWWRVATALRAGV
jgi:N-acetylmuramoyl-L-alanine amidase